MAQLLGQVTAEAGADTARSDAGRLPPDAAARGSEAYRRAGAEPADYSQEPNFYRILA